MAFTQVSGTIVDPSGVPYAGANLTARLVASATPRVGGNLIDTYTSVKLDANGSFTLQLADNATVAPVASTWTFQVDTDNSSVPPPLGTGPQSFSVAGITITGAAQSVSAQLQGVAPELTRRPTRMVRTPYTWTAGDQAAGFATVPVVFSIPFADANYVAVSMTDDISNVPALDGFFGGDMHLKTAAGFEVVVYAFGPGLVAPGSLLEVNTIAVHV